MYYQLQERRKPEYLIVFLLEGSAALRADSVFCPSLEIETETERVTRLEQGEAYLNNRGRDPE